MKQRLHKFTALLLSLVMCISLLPAPAFAAGNWNGGGSSGTGEYKPSGDGKGNWLPQKTTALRVTMVAYYDKDYSNGEVVGVPIDIVLDDSAPTVHSWYRSNIFYNQMRGVEYGDILGGYTKDIAWISTKDNTSLFGTGSNFNFPRVSTAAGVKGIPEKSMVQYLLNDGEPTAQLNYILEKYIELANNNGKGFGSDFSKEKFSEGFYFDSTVWYVAYLEPVMYVDNKGTMYALTLREMLNPMNDFANPGGGQVPGDIWFETYTSTRCLSDGLYIDTDQFKDNLKLTKYKGMSGTVAGIDKWSAGLGVLQVTPEDAHDTTVASHINIFMGDEKSLGKSQGEKSPDGLWIWDTYLSQWCWAGPSRL